jgi:Zn-finger nucleic acid-binding protein
MAGNQVNEDEVQVGSETAKSCPACQAMLSDGTIQCQPVLYCTQCRGLLVSLDKFLPLVESLRALRTPTGLSLEPRDNSDSDRKLACPECGNTMTAYPYGGPGNVNLDSCQRCSMIWLDRRELWRIVLAPDHYPVYSSYDGVST